VNVFVLRGCSGSGKSWLTKAIADQYRHYPYPPSWWKDRQRTEAVSADAFFEARDGLPFDVKLLGVAHGGCLRLFDDQLRAGDVDLIVDNTNTSIAEVSPYIALGLAREATLHVIALVGDPIACWRRSRHGVSLGVVLRQDLELRKSMLEWPSWWPTQHVLEAGATSCLDDRPIV